MKLRIPILSTLIAFLFLGLIFLEAPTGSSKKRDQIITISTKFGDMKFVLYDSTPLHKANFIKLAKDGFYDSTTFHRVMNGFMIQGGDPNSKDSNPNNDGLGGPGYTIQKEFSPEHIHKKGALAAARQPDAINPKKESNGSQFYIVQGNVVPENQLKQMATFKGIDYTAEQIKIYREKGGKPHLDGEYTVFGEIISGINIIDSIAAVKTNRANRPFENIYMKMEVNTLKKKKITKIYNYTYPSNSNK